MNNKDVGGLSKHVQTTHHLSGRYANGQKDGGGGWNVGHPHGGPGVIYSGLDLELPQSLCVKGF